MELAPGASFGRYELVRQIAGGSYAVWEASCDGLPRALKIVPPSPVSRVHEHLVERTSALSQLEHPCLTRIFDVAMVGDRIAIAMELHSGIDLMDRVRREGPLSFPEAMLVAAPIAEALALVHRTGLWHGHLTPYRIHLSSSHVPKLLGFDAAALCGDGSSTMRILGNPRYVAPEQFGSGLPEGPCSDVYSFGLTVFEMCTGTVPHETMSLGDLVTEKLQPVRRLRSLVEDAPQELDDLLAAMLDPDPSRRPPIDALCQLAR